MFDYVTVTGIELFFAFLGVGSIGGVIGFIAGVSACENGGGDGGGDGGGGGDRSTTQLDNNPPHPTTIQEWDALSHEERIELGGVPIRSGGDIKYVMPSADWFSYFDSFEVQV